MLSAQRQANHGTPYVLKEADIGSYLQDMESRDRRKGTLDNYHRCLEDFLAWLPEGKEIFRERVYAYQEHLAERYTPGTVNMKMTTVNGLLDFLDLRECQVTAKLQVDKDEVKPELTRSEYLRMLAAAKANKDGRLYLLIKLFATTGIGVQEIVNVTVEAVQTGSVVTFPNRNRQEIRIPPCVQGEILSYAKENGIQSGPVFLTRQGTPLGRTSISNMVPRISKDARVEESKCTPRCLQKLYEDTQKNIRANVAVMLQMTYDRMLEQEQVTFRYILNKAQCDPHESYRRRKNAYCLRSRYGSLQNSV